MTVRLTGSITSTVSCERVIIYIVSLVFAYGAVQTSVADISIRKIEVDHK